MEHSETIIRNLLLLLRVGLGITALDGERDGYDPALLPEAYRLAKRHDLAHIVAYAVKKNKLACDAELLPKLDKQHMIALFRYQHQKHDLSVITRTLEAVEIEHIPLKGSVIRSYYPAEWMRTGCDIDILVREADLDRAIAALTESAGYKYESKGPHDVALTSPAGTHLELHYDLIEEEVHGADTVLERFFDCAKPIDGKKYTLAVTDEMFYYYHVGHMAKHFVNGGCGIRPFVDLWVLNNRISFDKEKRDALLAEGNYDKFENGAKALSEVWFSGKEHTELTRSIEEFILGAGVYGNMQNRVAVRTVKKGSRLKYLMSRIFVSYEDLKYLYPSLDGRKWLLPFYQVRRWSRLVFCGRLKSSLREINTASGLSADESNKVSALLANLGIE